MRFLNGLNGRLPRICQYLTNANNSASQSKVTDNSVTTILLNPTAVETLSKSRYLRLEIGKLSVDLSLRIRTLVMNENAYGNTVTNFFVDFR